MGLLGFSYNPNEVTSFLWCDTNWTEKQHNHRDTTVLVQYTTVHAQLQ